jgi:hypothetical protein
MQLQERADPSVWQAGQQPQLPQRAGGIERSPGQLLACLQQLVLVAWRGKRVDPDVVGEIERGSVDPQGPAQPEARPVQQLPERATKCSLGSRCRRTASTRTRPSSSSRLVPSRMASPPMSVDHP